MLTFSSRRLMQSFRCAFRGLKRAFLEEQTFRVQVIIIGSVIVVLMLCFHLSTLEKAVIVLVIFFIWILELINTVFERLTNIIKPNITPEVRAVKDIMAGAVLLGSIGAVIIAFLIFGTGILAFLMSAAIILGLLLSKIYPRIFR